MNTKNVKFLAALAVIVMAFAVFAVALPAEDNDAADAPAAKGLYTYSATTGYTIVTFDAAKTISEDTTWYAYSPTKAETVEINQNVTVAAGVTLTLVSYGDEVYKVKLAAANKIDITATASVLEVVDVELIIDKESTASGAGGIVGGGTATTAAAGTVVLYDEATMYMGMGTDGSKKVTANIKAYAGATVVQGLEIKEGLETRILVGSYDQDAAMKPAKSSGYTEEDYILYEWKTTTTEKKEFWTIHMDAMVNDNRAQGHTMISDKGHIIVPEGYVVTIINLNGTGDNDGLAYKSTVENNGTIIVDGSSNSDGIGRFFFAGSSTAADVSKCGILGDGKVIVKNKAMLVINEGSAKPFTPANSSAINNMFAIGHNTIVVEYGGKMIAANNDSTTQYWGIVGPTAATNAAPSFASLADVDKFIWVPAKAGATITIEAKYTDPAGSETSTITSGAVYMADGAVTLGSASSDGYDWADRFDEIIVNSGTTTIAAVGFKMAAGYSGPTLTIESGATMTLAAQTTSTFTTVAGDLVYVKGKLDISGMTNTLVDKTIVVFNGGELYLNSTSETALPAVVYQGGKIFHGTTERTNLYTANTTVEVTNETALREAIDQGASDIVIKTNAITLADSITIPSGTKLTIDTVKLTIPTGKQIIVAGATIDGTLTVGTIDVKVTKLSGNFTISTGSVYIDGVIAGGAVELAAGDHHITGSLNGELTITASGAANVYFDDFTVNSTGKLILDDTNLTYKVGGTTDADVKYMYLYGTIVPKDTGDSITITVNKAVKKSNSMIAFAGAQLSGKVKVTGTGSIDLSQAQNTLYIDEDISSDKEFGQLESVVIVGSLSIKNNSAVTIYGTLTVNEGVTLTVEKGSSLTVNSAIAKVLINGRLIVEDGATFTVTTAEAVTVAGTLVSSGTVTITNGAVTVAKGGAIDIKDEDGSSITVGSGLTISAGGQMTVRSSMNINAIDNKGTITLNGAVLAATSNISMAASGAILDIVSVTGSATSTYALNITDLGLKFTSSSVVDEEIDNDVTISLAPTAAGKATTFKGLTITEAVTSYELSGTTYYTNHMDLFSASMILVDEDSKVVAGIVNINGYTMEVNLSLTLGAGMTLSNAQNLYVYGEIDATAYDVTALGATVAATAGKITVYGEITTRAAIVDAASYVNAAYYVENVLGVPYHHYTLLATAIDDEADNIKIFGTTGVSAALEIPAETVITIDAAGTLEIGSTMDNSVVVLVKDGATIKNGTIKVYGAITFENKKNCKSTVDSDVTVENGDAITYTSVYLAIANSSAGDVITITRIGETILPTSLTIPEDRTLSVPASRVLVLAPGTTLTVNGTLETAEKVLVDTSLYSDAKFDEKASVANHTAAIKVNGVFRSMAELTYAYYVTSGAYYTYADATGNYNYVSPVEIAVESTTKKITVYGTVTTGDIEWKGTSSSAKTFEVAALSKLTAGTLSFQYVTFDASAAIGLFSGTIQYGESSVSATEVDGLKISNPKYDDSYVMLVESVIVGDEDLFVISGGEVYVANVLGDMTIAIGATVLVPAGNDGFQMFGDLLVLGTLYVDNGRNATITNLLGASTVEVLGSIIVAPASEDGTKAKGNLTMDAVYVGTTYEAVHGDDATGIAAVLTGPVEFDILYAAADAIISEEILEDTTIKSTKYYVEDELYLTAFVPLANVGSYPVALVDYEIETAYFDAWYNEDEVAATLLVGKVGQTGWEYVEALINYNVYTLVVKTDNGIKSVAVDGKELVNVGNNVFMSFDPTYEIGFMMTAGKYTLSFTLKDGYEGTPVLYDSDGKAVIGGYGITVDGDYEEYVTYQLSGTQPIVPEPTPEPTPVEEKEWTITTILLVILVILIAIMAVIVALRLNRN